MAKKKIPAKKAKVRPIHKTIRGDGAKLPTEKEMFAKMNTVIQKFMKHPKTLSYQSSWNLLIPVLSMCYKKGQKVTFKNVRPSLWNIKILTQHNKLDAALTFAVVRNNPDYLWRIIYLYILWYNDKNK